MSEYPELSNPLVGRVEKTVSQTTPLLYETHTMNDYDPLLGWVLKPNFIAPHFVIGNYGIRMNSDNIIPSEKGGILFVGDSFTAGSGVHNEETWPALIEKETGERCYNSACGAWGLDQQYLRLRQLVPILKPKKIVWGILTDNVERMQFRMYYGGYKPYFDSKTYDLKNVPTPVCRDSHDTEDNYQHCNYAEAIETALYLISQANLYFKIFLNIDIKVILLYGYYHVIDQVVSPYIRPFCERFKELGIDHLDMYNVYQEVLKKDGIEGLRKFFILEQPANMYGHPSPEGCKLIKEKLCPIL